ncbi:hypothetical protein [Streptomyces sp. CA-146814]|uniref:hypothetical protein n=1 Tax=Streptomyces sp. CA-146814 TaxID=3240053 RepID=UPI003D9344D2
MFIIVSTARLSIDRIAADVLPGKRKRLGVNVQIFVVPFDRLLWAVLALPGSSET